MATCQPPPWKFGCEAAAELLWPPGPAQGSPWLAFAPGLRGCRPGTCPTWKAPLHSKWGARRNASIILKTHSAVASLGRGSTGIPPPTQSMPPVYPHQEVISVPLPQAHCSLLRHLTSHIKGPKQMPRDLPAWRSVDHALDLPQMKLSPPLSLEGLARAPPFNCTLSAHVVFCWSHDFRSYQLAFPAQATRSGRRAE